MTKEQAAILSELPLLFQRALAAGLPVTARAIERAVKASGWEAAGDFVRATMEAHGEDALRPRKK